MIFLPSAKFMYRPQTTVAPWTPLSLGNTVLYGWYKADAGVPVSTDGASVATWADQSATPHNLTQSTPANRPVFRTAANGINGIPVLEFPSSSTTPAFFNETAFPANTNGFSFYIVSRNAAYSASAQYAGAFAIGDTSAGSINQFCNVPGATTTQKIRVNGASDFGESLISSNYTVTKVSRAAALTSLKYQTTYTPLQIYSNTNTFAIQPGFWIGKNYVGSVGGKIAEVIVCNRELTTGAGSEEASLDAYFRARYGFGLYYGADLPVANPALWLDASRWDTLYTDNLMTTAATTDNGPIGGWKDLSGNNRHALQTFTNRPTWRTPVNGKNGLGMMSFNGSSQWMDIASFPSLASGYTFYAVLKQPSTIGVAFSSPGTGVAGASGMLWGEPTTGSLLLTQWGAKIGQIVTTGSVVGYIANYDGAHTTGNYFLRTSQGTADTTGTMTQNTGTPQAGTAMVGRAATSYYFNSSLYELVVLPRQSTTTEDTAWKTYTAAKWGVTWS
jgi:hypothetical protein